MTLAETDEAPHDEMAKATAGHRWLASYGLRALLSEIHESAGCARA